MTKSSLLASAPTDSITLDALLPGEKAIIRRVHGTTHPSRIRLLEMGLTAGTEIEFIRRAPFGDPIEIRVRGYRLSLRKIEAVSILVTKGDHS